MGETMTEPKNESAEARAARVQNWPHGSIRLMLPEECVTVRVGDRDLYAAPANLDPTETSEWNQHQYAIQELLEQWAPMPVTPPPTDSAIDVGAQSTTRDQLREVTQSTGYWEQQQRLARVEMDRFVLEQRLSRLLAQSQHRKLDRQIATAEAGARRAVAAQERLLAEAPAALHERLTDLSKRT